MTFTERGICWSSALLAIFLIDMMPRQAFSAWTVGTPIVTFWGGHPLTAQIAQRDVAGGYNHDWASSWAEVSVAGQYGLRARLRSDYYLGNLLWPTSLDGGTKQAQLNALIDQYKTYPAAYAYFTTDEPTTTSEIDNWAPLINYVRARDPDRLVYLNMGAPSWTGVELWNHYIDTVKPQMLSYDYYNFMKTSSGAKYDEPFYFYNLGKVAGWGKANNIPFMNTVQACAWEPTWRVPNENELRFLVYSTLAYGAQGISYFNYYTNAPNTGGIQFNPDGTPTSIYTSLATLNPQFVKVSEQLQSMNWIGTYMKGYQYPGVPGTEQLPAASPFNIASVSNTLWYNYGDAVKGVLFGLFAADGNTLGDSSVVLIQNLDYSLNKTYTLSGPGNLSIFDATAGHWTPMGSNQVVLNLLPGGGILVGLTSVVTAVPGDFDGDGDVDGADFVVWQTNFPTATSAALATGDADGDGDVDGADFVVWQTNFPFTPGPGVAPVPEPGSVILAILGSVLGIVGKRLLQMRRNGKLRSIIDGITWTAVR